MLTSLLLSLPEGIYLLHRCHALKCGRSRGAVLDRVGEWLLGGLVRGVEILHLYSLCISTTVTCHSCLLV